MLYWKSALITLAIAVPLAGPGMASVSGHGSAAMAQQLARADKNRKPTRPPATAPALKTVKGDLVSFNVETGVLTVSVKHRDQTEEVAVTTDLKTTEFTIDNVGVTIADLKPGMALKATLDTANVATKVEAKSLPAPKRERKPKTKG